MDTAAVTPVETLPPDPFTGKDELNLAEFPITLLTDRPPAGKNELVFQDTIRDPKTGKELSRRLTVSSPARYGLPTAKDDEVLLGLVQLTKLDHFRDRTVPFSRHALIHLLGWPDSGQSYKRLNESLDRWLAVYLSYEKAWWDRASESWVDAKFHILDNAFLYDSERRASPGEKGQMSLPFSSFTWNEVIFRSFRARYMRDLDFGTYIGLSTATAKRMYRFLGKRFYHGRRWEFDLEEFAFVHVGLSRESCLRKSGSGASAREAIHNAKIKEKLAPAIRELEGCGLLEPLPPAERYTQQGRGSWRVIFVEKGGKKAKALPAVSGPAKELEARGVTVKTAAELAGKFSVEAIAAKIEVFDWLRESGDTRLAKNPAGYLVKSIRDDYQPPPGFEPRAERERKKRAAEEWNRKQEEKKAAARKVDAEQRRAIDAQREHIAGVLDALPADTRTALERRAIAAATPEERERLDAGSAIAQIQRRLLIDRLVMAEYPMAAAG